MILVIGDIMLDTYIEGVVRRISPEAPVPILQVCNESNHLGGAANVANNIVKLGGLCTLISAAGSDPTYDKIRVELESARVPSMIFTSPERWTTIKTRYEAHGQQILRVDDECTDDLSDAAEEWIAKQVTALFDQTKVIVLSDYGKGVLTYDLCQWVIRESFDRHIPVIVDPKGKNFSRYIGAALIKPNADELAQATGKPTDKLEDCIDAAKLVQDTFNIPYVLVTRGHRGMTLVSTDGVYDEPGFPRAVANVVGAGDTALAALAVGVSEDSSYQTSMRFANMAASLVVGKHGTAWVTRQEVSDAFIGT